MTRSAAVDSGGVTRSGYWDGWKGLSIIAVLFIHAASGAGNYSAGSFNWLFGIVILQFFDFAVPLFLAISGLFSSSCRSPREFYIARFTRIVPPYLFWSFVYILIINPSHFVNTSELFDDLVFGKGITIGYFVIVLLQFVLLTPAICRIKNTSSHILLTCGITICSLLCVYSLKLFFPDCVFSEFPYYAVPFFVWYPFFHLGILFSNNVRLKSVVCSVGQVKLLFVICLFFVLSIIEGVLLAKNGFYSFGVSQVKFSSFAFSFCLFMFCLANSTRADFWVSSKLLSSLGRNSYPIYLIHLLFLMFVGKLFRLAGLDAFSYPLFVLACVICCLLLCYLVIACAKYFLPKAVIRITFGI